jgi:ribosomal protein S12 methylthiotransferase
MTQQQPGAQPKIGLVSLGCPKALVDSERIMSTLRAQGYAFSRDYEGADIVLVNTCGFLDSAKQESLEAIGEALAENGLRLTPRHYAYLKISEGCNNRCSFCIIPQIRGDLASRPAASVLYEAERLVAGGVKEIMVISQDTSAYGVDTKYATSKFRGRDVRAKFHDLVEELGKMDVWTRLHYVYPYPHVDSVIPLMAEGKILPYLDIPFQHASPTVLKAMRRPANQEKTLDRIRKWREICPDLTIRSNFIVGFPGETDADFEALLDFVEEAEIDRAGVFKYEPVTGAPANDLEGIVSAAETDARFAELMEVAQVVSTGQLAKKVGRTIEVLVDDVRPEQNRAIARSKWDAPDIDGQVIVDHATGIKPGDKLEVLVTGSDEYDLFARPVTSTADRPLETAAD